MKALVVDDRAVNRTIIVAMLSSVGIAVREADGANACMELFEAERFDLVLMDIRMPKVDGFEAIRRIRSMPGERAQVPIIVMTADVTDDCAALAKAAGAGIVLHKPLSLGEFLNSVALCISGSREALLA